MLTSLDWLVIVYMGMVAASLLSLCLMFLVRRPRIKQVCLYIVAALGVYAASVGIRIGLGLFPVQVAVGVAAGAASIGAIVLERTAKGSEKKLKTARILAAAALVIGVINTFM
ncbi:MAG: hypothetical protein E7482_06775 [Ruminococcaceae bacterium]|nr:hypothetical protein [Oscillospiraceae bacterium]